MDDRELLMLAAKAVGVEFHGWIDYPHENSMAASGDIVRNEGIWVPLTDDGDALRLATQLDMNIFHTGGNAYAMESDSDGSTEQVVSYRDAGGKNEAARRAIVRCAAEIGKAMTNG